MNYAAVLAVLVKAEGVAKTAAQVEGLEQDMGKATSTGNQFAASVDKADQANRKMGAGADTASKKVAGLTGDMTKARKATDLWQDSAGKWRNSMGQLASDAEKAASGIDRLDRSSRRGSGGIGGLSGVVEALGGGFGPLLGSLVVAGPLMLALGGAAFALIAALAPLVGLAGAAAVGLTALGQAAGVVALASMGVGDALKEQMAAGDKTAKAATTSADQQRTAARAIASAQEGVRTAHEQVRAATENLTQAERAQKQAIDAVNPARRQAARDLEDMRSALTDAALSEKVATRDLADAKKVLATAWNPTDAIRLADAQATLTTSTLSEQRAVMGLTNARQALEDLMKPADALTIADATDAVADATRGQTRAAQQLAAAQKAAAIVVADPTSDAAAKAAALLDVADAQNAIGDAARASEHAQAQLAKLQAPPDAQAVAKAQMDIADAQDAVTTATRGTAKAAQDVTDAQKGMDPDTVAAATLAVAQAQKTLTDATRSRVRLEHDLAAAEAAGINGSAGVVTARERVAAANRQITAAQRELTDASRGVTKAEQAVKDAQLDAAKSAGAAAAANVDLNEKFNALPPAAQAFVRTLQGLKPKLDDLRATAASGLFPGVVSGINAAMGSFGSVKKVVGETSTVLGGLAKRAGELVGSSAFGKDIETVGSRNALIIDRLGHAAIYVGDALRHVIVAAGPLTTWLSNVALGWAKSADGAAKAGRESGALAGFFQKTRNTLITVASIVGNLATAFFNAGKAAAPFGRDMLGSIDKVTAKFAEWTKSIDGQSALQDFFKQSKELAGQLFPIIGSVVKSLGEMAFRVLPAYLAILKAVGPLAGPLIQTFIALKLAASAAGAISKIAVLANPVGLVALAIVGLGIAFVVAYKRSERFREVVDAAWAAVKKAVSGAISYVQGWLSKHRADLERVGKALTNLGTAAVWAFEKVILPVVQRVLPIITGMLQGFLRMVGGIIKTISGILTGDWDAAWQGMKETASGMLMQIGAVLGGAVSLLWDAAKLLGEAIWGGLKSGLVAIADVFTAPFKAAWDALLEFFGVHSPSTLFAELGGNLIAGLVNGLKAGLSSLLGAAKWVGDQLVAGVKAYVAVYKDAGGWVLDKIVAGFKAVTSGIAGAAKWLFETVKGALDSLAGIFTNRGKDVLEWIVTGITTATAALAGVAGWLVTQLKTGFTSAAGFFTNRGQEVIGWITDGIRSVPDKLANLATWLVDQLTGKDGILSKAAGSFKGVGGEVIGWIVDGFKGGIKKIGEFAKSILDIVGKIPGVGDVVEKGKSGIDKALKTAGFARGGAFARTGGIVDSPITLMGEEAPRHPEFVIPTNPAYRGRAQKLAMQAASAVGLATGGVYTASKFGGHDDPSAYGHKTASGAIANDSLWGFAELSNPPGSLNFAALGKLAMGTKIDIGYGGKTAKDVPKVDVGAGGPGLDGHVRAVDMTYAVAQALGFPGLGNVTVNGGGGKSIIDKVTGAVGGAVSGVADMVSGLVSKLPSAGDLGWLKGTGEYALGKVKDWIGDKAKGLFSGGGSSVDVPSAPSGVDGLGMFDGRQVAKWIIPELQYARNHGWDGHLTSGWRSASQVVTGPVVAPQGHSEHQGTQYPHGAVDFGGPYDAAGLANKMAFIAATEGFTGHRLLSALGFRDDGHMSGTGHYNGGIYGGSGLLGSYETGTPYVPQTGPYLLHRGEAVTPAGENRSNGRGDGPLVHIENAHFSDERDVTVFAREIGFKLG